MHFYAQLISFLLLFTFSFSSQAQYLSNTQSQNSEPILIAQAEIDDGYDPFSDYSEFDETTDEEADIYFFRHGRFFTLGVALGYRFFTDNLARLYNSAPTYGLFMTFFSDLRLATQFGFTVGDYAFNFPTESANVTGNVSLTVLHVNMKYFINTQTMTRGVADLNPYLIGGLEQFFRTYTTSTISGLGSSRDSTMGLNFGVGIEIPFNRKRSFIGIQTQYHHVQFADENALLRSPETDEEITRKVSGDTYDLMAILGFNY